MKKIKWIVFIVAAGIILFALFYPKVYSYQPYSSKFSMADANKGFTCTCVGIRQQVKPPFVPEALYCYGIPLFCRGNY